MPYYKFEHEMSDVVKEWLLDQGKKVYVEVPNGSAKIDMVGTHNDHIDTVELKLHLTDDVIFQAVRNLNVSHKTWIAIACTPRESGLKMCRSMGVGVLVIRDGEIRILLKAERLTPHDPLKVRRLAEGGTAGHKTQKGEGPKLRVFEAVKAYLTDHPDATWRQIYEAVPNHYKTAKSMGGALGWWRHEWEYKRDQLRVDADGNLVGGSTKRRSSDALAMLGDDTTSTEEDEG